MPQKKNAYAEPEGSFLAGPEATDSEPDDRFGFLEPVERAEIVDPDMDPASKHWNPKKYFGAQKKYTVVIRRNESDVLSDPGGKTPIFANVGINGYMIKIQKDTPTVVPRDFAAQIVEYGAGFIYGETFE